MFGQTFFLIWICYLEFCFRYVVGSSTGQGGVENRHIIEGHRNVKIGGVEGTNWWAYNPLAKLGMLVVMVLINFSWISYHFDT